MRLSLGRGRALLLAALLLASNVHAAANLLAIAPDYALAPEHGVPRESVAPWAINATRYDTFAAIEWQLKLHAEAPVVLDAPNSADFIVTFPNDGDTLLHWSRGSHAETADFQPMQSSLPLSLASFGGRSSDGAMPYFNLARGDGGLIFAIGWTGDWQANFEVAAPNRIHLRAGLRHARIALPAGETLRMPSILAMAYRGTWLDGQNKFRRLMLAHFTPKSHAPLDLMPIAASVHGMIGFNDTTEANLVALAQDIAALKLPIDTFWLDAGWNEGGFPLGQGNPAPDPVRFPNGLAPVGVAVGETGMRFLTWFEPERAMRGTWLDREHPAWLLSPTNTPPELKYQENDGFRLLDLGEPEARAWALDHVATTIAQARIGVYRQDFNLYPAYFWHAASPEESALREVRYINGLYAYLDALTARFPKLILDNCASGGRRLDFEMMRRSVALWRSDSCWGDKDFPRNVQAMAHGLSLWFPPHGLGAAATDTVSLRSGMGTCASFAINYRDTAAVEALRAHLGRFLPARAKFLTDFYPLTPWSTDKSQWIAYQFHDPKTNTGIVQAFCADTTGHEEIRLLLQGLTAATLYTVSDWDHEGQREIPAAELLQQGLHLKASRRDEAIVIEYAAPTLP